MAGILNNLLPRRRLGHTAEHCSRKMTYRSAVVDDHSAGRLIFAFRQCLVGCLAARKYPGAAGAISDYGMVFNLIQLREIIENVYELFGFG